MAVVQVQVLNKVIGKQDFGLIANNGITADCFRGYTDQFNYICEFHKQYGKPPDKETFISKFPDWEYFDVGEVDKALVDIISEQDTYVNLIETLKTTAKIANEDSIEALTYLQNNVNRLQPSNQVGGINIIKDISRVDSYLARGLDKSVWSIPSGFDKIDETTFGYLKGEDFILYLARVNIGKSFILVKSATKAWQDGYNVGFISPEMSANMIGYRFDSANKHFSNSAFLKGEENAEYRPYLEELQKNDNIFDVATPSDFGGRITKAKLRQYIISKGLDILFIDGVSYLADENYKKGDPVHITLGNISRHLIELSLELSIPIIGVAQANRNGDKDEEAPDLKDIKDSDAISYSATRVISVCRKGTGLMFDVKKNRYGAVGDKFIYKWIPDFSRYIYLPKETETIELEVRAEIKAPELMF